MRDTILSYLEANTVTGFAVSTELPYDAGGVPQYLNNYKKLYVDRTQTEQEPLLDTLDDQGIVAETSSVSVFVVVDAKTLPTNYDTLVSTVRGARLQDLTTGWTQRVTTVETTYEADALVTQFTFNFRKLIFN